MADILKFVKQPKIVDTFNLEISRYDDDSMSITDLDGHDVEDVLTILSDAYRLIEDEIACCHDDDDYDLLTDVRIYSSGRMKIFFDTRVMGDADKRRWLKDQFQAVIELCKDDEKTQ